MKYKLAQYKQYKEELSAELRKYVQDKKNPLDERFDALCECPELTNKKQWITFFNIDNNYLRTVYEDYNKYDEYLVKTILKNYCEINEDFEEDVITFKEYCCDNFISSMIFDW